MVEHGDRVHVDRGCILHTTTIAYPNRFLLSFLAFLFDAGWPIVRHARSLRKPEATRFTNAPSATGSPKTSRSPPTPSKGLAAESTTDPVAVDERTPGGAEQQGKFARPAPTLPL